MYFLTFVGLFVQLACIFGLASTKPENRFVVHERRSPASASWKRVAALDSEKTLPLKIALKQGNLELAEEFLLSVSHPASPKYGRYWTPRDVAQKFAPAPEAVSSVFTWITDSGITPTRILRSHSGGWLEVNATVHEAEELFKTKYHVYYNSQTGQYRAACDEYQLPESIQRHIEFVIPTIQFDIEAQRKEQPSGHVASLREIPAEVAQSNSRLASSDSALSKCSQRITPDCLRALYNIPSDTISHTNNSLGVVAFGWAAFSQADLSSFFASFNPEAFGRKPIFESIDGGTLQNISNAFVFTGESTLDMEYTMSLAHPQNVTLFQVGDLWKLGSMNNLLAAFDESYCGALDPEYDPIYPDTVPAPALGYPGGYNSSDCGNFTPTKVLSISYAWSEADYSPAYLQRQCLEYLKLGLQGVTVIFASGDYGTAGLNGACLNPQTGAVSNFTNGKFNPSFPSTCPWVTSVGGTQLPVNGSMADREIAIYRRSSSTSLARTLTSGGGFSNVFPAPNYQSRHIHQYLAQQKDHLSNISHLFNFSSTARAYPDVSVNAANYVITWHQSLLGVYGTSCSTPVFASIISKINEKRLGAGKSTAGFLNPVLYRNEWAFNDVIEGFNYGCGTEAFHAGEGWDPVTGLGTPDFEKLLEVYMKLP
ncbi:peptidase S8/S53 domain-containing protein [Bisporella sp. PMI_857]|nr:peptidase S8/S53 domain-containing protein [Bisporella sp. PMI_857]